jgi:hypothetical protein
VHGEQLHDADDLLPGADLVVDVDDQPRLGGLTDEQLAVVPSQDEGDDGEQHADRDGRPAVPVGVAGQVVQPDADSGEDDADQRGAVLGQDGLDRRVLAGTDVPP